MAGESAFFSTARRRLTCTIDPPQHHLSASDPQQIKNERRDAEDKRRQTGAVEKRVPSMIVPERKVQTELNRRREGAFIRLHTSTLVSDRMN